jgi:hypothetical protein
MQREYLIVVTLLVAAMEFVRISPSGEFNTPTGQVVGALAYALISALVGLIVASVKWPFYRERGLKRSEHFRKDWLFFWSIALGLAAVVETALFVEALR